jgi:hypothetical protein
MLSSMKFPAILSLCAVALASTNVAARDPVINISVGGEISPGVYGRVDFGNAPPPPVLYAQPVQHVVMQPLYLHVPPGHAKNWSKHCYRYDACARPVYFVRSSEYEPREGKGRGHGRGHGKHGRDD